MYGVILIIGGRDENDAGEIPIFTAVSLRYKIQKPYKLSNLTTFSIIEDWAIVAKNSSKIIGCKILQKLSNTERRSLARTKKIVEFPLPRYHRFRFQFLHSDRGGG